MSKEFSLLCVHGVSHSEADPEFRTSWTEAITQAVHASDPDLRPSIDQAVAAYAAEVRSRAFPAADHTYTMKAKTPAKR